MTGRARNLQGVDTAISLDVSHPLINPQVYSSRRSRLCNHLALLSRLRTSRSGGDEFAIVPFGLLQLGSPIIYPTRLIIRLICSVVIYTSCVKLWMWAQPRPRPGSSPHNNASIPLTLYNYLLLWRLSVPRYRLFLFIFSSWFLRLLHVRSFMCGQIIQNHHEFSWGIHCLPKCPWKDLVFHK